MTESEISKAILKELRARGCFCFKHWSGGFVSRKGISDILGCLPCGRFLAIEVKRHGFKPTDDQERFVSDVNTCGGLAFVARSVDDVVEQLALEGVYNPQRSLF